MGQEMAGGYESMQALEASVTASVHNASAEVFLAPYKTDHFVSHNSFYWQLKRPVGFVLASLATLLALPALITIALVLMQRGRPVFIRRRRLGLHGRPFTSYYFRTMRPDALRSLTEIAPAASANTFERLLDKTHLDRLPLLWNVVRGDMNLVGPRPLSVEELYRGGRAARHTLSVRPGLTGPWWIKRPDDFRQRLALDRSYIDHASPLLDCRILARTLVMMHGG